MSDVIVFCMFCVLLIFFGFIIYTVFKKGE
jgi:hypothetical protein